MIPQDKPDAATPDDAGVAMERRELRRQQVELRQQQRELRQEKRAMRRMQRLAKRGRLQLRLRRRGRRAYIRSVYFLPSLATLGNAICGFAAIYVAGLTMAPAAAQRDWVAQRLAAPAQGFPAAAYLLFAAMVFDALDGRLARFARHTTDFGGQLDSLADVISFGVAPAYIALQLFKQEGPPLPVPAARLVWAIGAIYLSCAAIRLARFNVSNEHGEQHHYSFLGLPSPGAAGAVASFILLQQFLRSCSGAFYQAAATICVAVLPLLVLATGLLMVSNLRYPHLVNRYLRGRRSIGRLVAVVAGLLLLIVAHQVVVAVVTVGYSLWGPLAYALRRHGATEKKLPH